MNNIFSRYFSGSGRIAKGTWLLRVATAAVCAAAFGTLAQDVGGMPASATVAALFLASAAALCAQRLHDTGSSAGWLLVFAIPVLGPLWLLLQMLRGGAPGPNRYGADPGARHGYLLVDISK